MSRKLSVLDHVRVASPCPVAWNEMTGDERVRHCRQCDLNVFNLSEMSRREAEALIQSKTGRLCVTYFQRSDGTILTQNCPVGLRRVRRMAIRGIAAFAASFVFIGTTLAAIARGETGSGDLRLRFFEPFARVTAWFDSANMISPQGSGRWTGGALISMPKPTHQDELEYPQDAAANLATYAKIEEMLKARGSELNSADERGN